MGRPRGWAFFGALACLVLLAVLVTSGAAGGLDQYAVDHWMPWLAPAHHRLLDLRSLLLPGTNGSRASRLVDLWTYPASVAVSAAVVGACAVVLDRRSRRGSAVALCLLWVAGNAVELAGKTMLARPALYLTRGGTRIHVQGFDHSFPSGHTIRGFLVAVAIAYTWRRGAPLAVAWFLGVPFALVALGDHTPTDVLGGLLVAAALVAGAVRYGRNARIASWYSGTGSRNES